VSRIEDGARGCAGRNARPILAPLRPARAAMDALEVLNVGKGTSMEFGQVRVEEAGHDGG